MPPLSPLLSDFTGYYPWKSRRPSSSVVTKSNFLLAIAKCSATTLGGYGIKDLGESKRPRKVNRWNSSFKNQGLRVEPMSRKGEGEFKRRVLPT